MLHRRRAFTIVELLAVVAIIAVIISLLLIAIPQVQRQSRSTLCLSNQRQLNFAYQAYASDNGGQFMSPQTGSSGAVPDNEWLWVRSSNLSVGQGESVYHLERGAMWSYAGEVREVYKSPFDPFPDPMESQMNVQVGDQRTRVRTYALSTFLGQMEFPEGTWGQRHERERNKGSKMGNPAETILTVLEYDHRGHNMGGFAIDLQGSGVWTDKIAAWHPGVWNFSMLDGSTLSHRYAATVEQMEYQMTRQQGDFAWPGPDYEWLRRHLDPEKF